MQENEQKRNCNRQRTHIHTKKKNDLRDLEKLQHIAVSLYLFDDGDLTQWDNGDTGLRHQ